MAKRFPIRESQVEDCRIFFLEGMRSMVGGEAVNDIQICPQSIHVFSGCEAGLTSERPRPAP